MLTLIIEIALTVAAWRKGWGPRALLPLGVLIPTAFVMGLMVGAAGGPGWLVVPLGLLLDIACIGVLITLSRQAPRPAAVPVVAGSPAAASAPGHGVLGAS